MAIRLDYSRGVQYMSSRSFSGLLIRRTALRLHTLGALHAAEKLVRAVGRAFRAVGRGFIPGINPIKSTWALAPEVCFSPESWSFSAACVALLCALPATAQYSGQVSKNDKDHPELRSIAVLEWTGDPGKPKASRLVPVTVLDGGELQDGGIYLARPQPLALAGEVEYELQENGRQVGLFDIENTGQEQGSWVGYGAWKPMPKAKAAAPPRLDKDENDAQSDEPVLHRKRHPGDAPAGGTGAKGSTPDDSSTSSADPAPAADPDRPTLHKAAGASDSSNTTDATSTSSADPDQPTLHRHTDSSSTGAGSSSASSDDPDRPVLKKTKKKEDVGQVDSMPDITDPDRPRLKRGKSDGYVLNVIPSLLGLPPDMQQAVAVSDAKNHPEHPWAYTWSNPDDEAKMKSALEEIARSALGLNPPPPSKSPAKPKTAAARKGAKPAPPPPPPATLEGEQFRVFELSYGSGATLVLQAHTAGPLAQQKFVTLVAQPDLYGNVLLLLKSVTDGAHLDDTPRMRLVDAVDAMADNRGELLFELRGATQRQFALYRVLRGQAEKLFVTGGGEFGTETTN